MTVNKKELFSEKVSAGSLTYFFGVKGSVDGTKYLVISESRQDGGESYKHSRVMIFEEHILVFHEGLKKALKFMETKNKSYTYNVGQMGNAYTKAYAKWTEDEDIRLRNEYIKGKTMSELTNISQRNPGAIRSRLKKVGLL